MDVGLGGALLGCRWGMVLPEGLKGVGVGICVQLPSAVIRVSVLTGEYTEGLTS